MMGDSSLVATAGQARGAPLPCGVGHGAKVAARDEDDLLAAARVRAHLREQMALRGINRTELAKRIGQSKQNAGKILNGTRGLGLGVALKICRGLRITATRLLEEDPPDEFWGDDDPRQE